MIMKRIETKKNCDFYSKYFFHSNKNSVLKKYSSKHSIGESVHLKLI